MGLEAAAIGGGLSLLGGIMGGNAAQEAAQTSANAQLQAAKMAAEAAKFRPVGVTTRFGTSSFQTSPEGYVTGAGYTVSPELQAYQNRLMALANQGLGQAEQAQQQYAPLTAGAQGLFNLGQQYIAQSPEQVAADYMAKQQALLAPSREQQSAQLLNQLSNTGRTGLSIAQGGALGASNPEMQALANARAMQDLQLAANAQQAGQQATQFGAGLLGTGAGLLGNYYSGQTGALSPFQTNLGLTGTIENLGQNALTLGQQLGGQNVSNTAANALLQGGLSAAQTAQRANSYSPWATGISGLGNSPLFAQAMSPYVNAQLANAQYGSGNVYGFGGAGTVPEFTGGVWSGDM